MLQKDVAVRNATLDGDVIIKLFPDVVNFIWPIETQFYDEDGELNVCLGVTFEYRYVKGGVGT